MVSSTPKRTVGSVTLVVFGRYPAKIEDLELTSQQRFLRKRYKDPITGKDFRLLHYGEAKLALGGMGGGMIPGASAIV